ncbi:MAG: pentapeptide repeat-containing protein [Leptolyngbyaceae cyanobacterium SL_7_1]|nr:pentapeptide repeat-containing protein [Leptolyngbyaceae cyanobacterium SL_7_1]
MANEEHLARLMKGVESWNAWVRVNYKVRPDLRDADLSKANLFGADLNEANLKGATLIDTNLSKADLGKADLSGADLSGADLILTSLSYANFNKATLNKATLIEANLIRSNFSGATLIKVNLDGASLIEARLIDTNLSGANLTKAKLIDANLSGANLSGANLTATNFSGAYLKGTNLSGADLTDANLSGAYLKGANLSNALLIASQLSRSNLTHAILTGACIQDWNINSETQLNDVTCEYVYLKAEWSPQQERSLLTNRRPSDPNRIFAPGEFAKLFQKALETVDLIFVDGIDWKAFFQSFQELRSQYDDDNLSIQAIEKKSGGTFVIRLEVSPEADKGTIERHAKELYERDRQLLEAEYRAELHAKDREIESYKRESTNMMEIAKLLASKPITVEAKAVAESQSNSDTFNTDLRGANVANFANKVQDNARQQANQNIYTSSEKQSLAEAAAEIQKLLKQLEQTNPTATEAEQKAFVTAAIPATIRQRAVGALQAGGETAIAEFLDNPYVNVAVAIVKGWREAGE